MKRGIMVIAMCVMSLFVFASMSQAAALVCSPMEPQIIGEDGVWLKNVSGQSCGSIANNAFQYLVFDDSKINRQLAITLSAMSLDQYVWVYMLGDTKNSIIDTIMLKK